MREKLLLDDGWLFFRGEIAKDVSVGHQETYMRSKSDRGRGPENATFYDSDWEKVSLPHDFVINTEYDKDANGNHGFLNRDNGWYRRYFQLDEKDAGKRFVLTFDGAGMKAKVWVNGHLMIENRSMYNSFEFDFTAVAKIGKINSIAVYIENDEFEGWWYEGAGIYRYVWLEKTDEVRLNRLENFVKPIAFGNDNFDVFVTGIVENHTLETKEVEVLVELLDNGESVQKNSEKYTVKPQNVANYALNDLVKNPTLWDTENPYLYETVVTLKLDGKVVDTLSSKTGFRTFEFTGDKGVILNGKPIKLKGSAIHQDHGSLGVAVPQTVEEYRIKKLKEMGGNAYRAAHNNPSPSLLDICDREGILVIDENRWFDLADSSVRQLESMVKRDRNHPCVFVYSVGNEEPIQSNEIGKQVMYDLGGVVKRLDDSRPVTLALNGGYYSDCATAHCDVLAPNYAIAQYDKLHETYPDKCIMITETGATTNLRGVYFEDEAYNNKTAYDEHFPVFGSSHRTVWEAIDTRDFISGMFIWTSIEYRGESSWPKLFSAGGGLDSCCFEKDNFYLLQALWKKEPILHIMPHWNWEDGKQIKVMTYTNADEVELILNGKSLGKQTVDKYFQNGFDVKFEKGDLKAIGYKDGAQIIEKTISTTKKASKLTLSLDNAKNDEGVAILRVTALDEDGNIVPDSKLLYNIKLDDNTKLLGASNGNAYDQTPVRSLEQNVYCAFSQIIVKQLDAAKPISVTITSEFGEVSLSENVQGEEVFNREPAVSEKMQLKGFRMWPLTAEKPDVKKLVDYDDMNTSIPVDLGSEDLSEMINGNGYVMYSLVINIPDYSGEKEIKIIFGNVKGETEVFVQHDANYWPSPEPRKYSDSFASKSCNDEKFEIVLKDFYKEEKILVNIVNRYEDNKCGFKGDIYWEIG